MERTLAPRLRMSPLARLGLAAVAGAVLVGAPMARAHAADARMVAHADTSDEPLTLLRHQLAEHRRDAGERLRGLVLGALDRTAQHVQDARRGMEKLVTFGYGLDGIEGLDFSALAGEVEGETEREREPEAREVEEEDEGATDEGAEEEPTKPAKPKRFEYVEGTDDPLAGL